MPTPPVAERRQHAVTTHGITRQDPYHWLRADNWQQVMQEPESLPADIRAYLEAENAYTKELLEDPQAALVEKIYREIRGRIKEDETGLPEVVDGRLNQGRVFDLELPMTEVAEAYAAMDERRAIKVLLRP